MLLSIAGPSADSLAGSGRVLELPGRTAAAELFYKRALHAQPQSSVANFNLADYYARSGRVDDAIARYTAALKRSPNDAATHNNLGMLLLGLGKAEEGEQHLRSALK